MPKKLRLHFYDLERQIIQFLSWEKSSPVVKKIAEILDKQKVALSAENECQEEEGL